MQGRIQNDPGSYEPGSLFLFFPFPSGYFRQVHTILVNILFMLYKLVAHSLIEISAPVAQLRQILDRFLHQVETVYLVLDTHIKRCGDRAFFFITADMNIAVIVTAIDELVYESRIAVESKDHRFIFGEEDIVFSGW